MKEAAGAYHAFFNMLLSCAVLFTVAAATIHDDRRAAFRPAAEILPEELEELIVQSYRSKRHKPCFRCLNSMMS